MRVYLGLLVLVFTLVTAGCLGPPTGSAKGRAKVAEWRVLHDEGLAVPHCPECDTVINRKFLECQGCGIECRIVQKTIDCPECTSTGDCSHCNAKGTCIACAGNGKCGICLGKGELGDAECPECEGARYCHDCAGTSVGNDCEYCEDSHECANCGGDGEIELR